jgi:hypothetical protein
MSCFTKNATSEICSGGRGTTTTTVEPGGTTTAAPPPSPFVLSYTARVGVVMGVVVSTLVILTTLVALGNNSTKECDE